MVYEVERVVRDVRVALDRNMTSSGLTEFGDPETLALDELIRSKICDGVRRVETVAPAYLLEEGHSFGDSVYWTGGGRGRVLLPDDFMRLINFRMNDWERTVYEALSPADPEYKMQSSRFGGIRGNPQKPVCAIVNRPEGKALEFYSCKSEDAYVAEGQYVPYPRIDEYGGIDISERCYRAVVYMTAGLVLLSYGEQEKASAMMEISKSMIQ